ncbi:MAG: hypothetical protein Q9196_001974 [Gyalolechia fulgens]
MPLPLGSIKPLGWLNDQMRLMSNGLAGHEYAFYPIVSDSVWLGGQSEYSGLNEGIPYWLNGLVPLAYGLDDDRLKGQTDDVVSYILDNQQSDGWLGPEKSADRDVWARFPLCLGLMQLVEADESRSARIIPALYKFITLMHRMLVHNIGYEQMWGRVRYPDMLITLQWLFEKHPSNDTHQILETMSLLDRHGLRWADYYNRGSYISKDLDKVRPPITADSSVFPYVHGVNAAQGMKAGAAIYRFNDDASLLDNTRNGVNWTLTYHGDPAGSIVGDERESGVAPNRGSELCTAVETMYSLSYLYQAMGDRTFADRCERAAFNALPVMFTSDLWTHQYLVVPNQPFAYSLDGPNPFWNTGDQSIFSPNTHTASSLVPDPHTGMLSLDVLETGTVDFSFTASIRTEDRGNDTISVYHGALLYALDVGFSDTTTEDVSTSSTDNLVQNAAARIPHQAHDHRITNTKPWNIAIDPKTLEYHTTATNTADASDALPNPIWAYEAPPNSITAKGCEIEWGIEKQLPTPPPARDERRCKGDVREVVLRPYGSLKVHMAVLPVMELV